MHAPEESRSADESEDSGVTTPPRKGLEGELGEFTDGAKSCARLAGKARTALEALAEHGEVGRLGSARTQLQKATELVHGLQSGLVQLAEGELARGRYPRLDDYLAELAQQLATHEVQVERGPEPYWLVYPAWFKVGISDRAGPEVMLNGNKLDTARPSRVAEMVHASITEPFDLVQFADLLHQVRRVLLRAGAKSSSIALSDIYQLLTVEPGRGAARRKDFTESDFYFSVHRLAEALDNEALNGQAIRFPPANRSDVMFFGRDRSSRKYLLVEFERGLE